MNEKHNSDHLRKQAILKRRKIRNIALNLICLSLAIAGSVWSIHYFILYYKYEITNDAYIDQYITPINAKAGGFVQDIRFVEHQPVHKGDTLLIINPLDYEIKVTEANAALAQSQAAKDALTANSISAESNIAVSDSKIKEKEAYLISLLEKEKRYKMLYEKGAVSRQDMELAISDYQAGLANLQALKMQQKASVAVFNESVKKQESGNALIDQRLAELELALNNLSYTVVIAPHDGIMGRRNIEVGQLIQPGQTISNLVEEQNKWVTANYKESQIDNIYIGQTVQIKVDAYNDKTFQGIVTAISGATGSRYSLLPVDDSAGNFVKVQQRIPVRIDFKDIQPDEMRNLRAGMMVITEAKIKPNN